MPTEAAAAELTHNQPLEKLTKRLSNQEENILQFREALFHALLNCIKHQRKNSRDTTGSAPGDKQVKQTNKKRFLS